MLYWKYLLILLIAGCSQVPVKTHRQLFDDFHTSYASADFEKMNQLLADDFKFINNGQLTSQKNDYIRFMTDWSKTFDTKWNVVSVQELGNTIQSIEFDTDIYNDFFQEGKMHYRYTYSFKGNSIQSIRADTLAGAGKSDLAYGKKLQAFHDWVEVKFPDKEKYLNGTDKQSAVAQKALLEQYIATEGIK
jgi:hypothetical protein